MTTDGANRPALRREDAPGLPQQTDWRGWMRWAASRNWADPDNWRQFVGTWDAMPRPELPHGGVEVTVAADSGPHVLQRHRDRPDRPRRHRPRGLSLLHDFLATGADVDAVTAALLREPLYATDFHRGFGTLYTAVARPGERSMTYHRPGREPWTHTLDRPRTDEAVVSLGPASHTAQSR
jgi:hypothetical protein